MNKKKNISDEVIDIIKREFKNIFDQQKYSLFSWGSLSRREMGPYSDLDMIIISDEKNINFDLIELFKQRISKALPTYYIDLLESYTLSELERISKVDGTDMQAYLFMRYELGKKITPVPKLNIVREILHIFCNLEYVYSNLYGSNNLKFGPYNIKYYNFAILLSKYYSGENMNTESSLRILAKKGKIEEEKVEKYIDNFNRILYYRNIVQESNKTYNCKIDREKILKMFNEKTYNDLKVNLLKISNESKEMYEVLKNIMFKILYENFSDDEVKFLNRIIILNEKISSTELDKIIKDNKEEIMMFLAYYINDPKILELIRSQNENKWYVLYGIANNKKASPETLYKLIDYRETKLKHNLKHIYQDFSWRNIYLYVAKNPSANKKIKNYILNYKNSRFMDIEAARLIKDE